MIVQHNACYVQCFHSLPHYQIYSLVAIGNNQKTGYEPWL
jgi:hypothetical protein